MMIPFIPPKSLQYDQALDHAGGPRHTDYPCITPGWPDLPLLPRQLADCVGTDTLTFPLGTHSQNLSGRLVDRGHVLEAV